MIIGIGTDISLSGRFSDWPDDEKKCRRWFHEGELEYMNSLSGREDRAACLAARFAAREALGKALGTGLKGMVLKDIEVYRKPTGQPCFRFHNRMKKIGENRRIFLSFSHDGDYVSAFAVIEESHG